MKRFALVPLLWVAPLGAQQASISSTTMLDINGNRVSNGPQITQRKLPNGNETTETMQQSLNGRMVPLERVETRVVRDDASGKVVERVTRRYDSQGNPGPLVKETIEEQKRPDGSSTIQTSTYRGDINGSMQLSERSVTESRKSDSSETEATTIQRPTINGSVETVEKRESTKSKQPNGSFQQQTEISRKDASGSFYTAVRQTIDHTQQGNQATDNTAEYERGPEGQLQLHGQTVTKTTTRPDGSQDIVADVFGQNVPGTVDSGNPKMVLQERQIIQKVPGPNNTVSETLSVRRPTISDPNTLGPEKQLSQTVCKGDCKP